MADGGAVDVPSGSGQRPGTPHGDRAVVVPAGGTGRSPAAWAPAVLTGHAVLLVLAGTISALLRTAGVRTPSRLDETGQWTGPPAGVPLAVWAIAVATVVLVIRGIGRRRPGRLAYWLAGTASWVMVPLTWLTVASAASAPERAGWLLAFYALTPYGWVLLVPLLLIGAIWTAVLARMSS